MLADDVWPVSVNDHLVEAPGLFRSHIAPSYRADAPLLIDLPDGGQAWQIGDSRLPLSVMLPSELTRREERVRVERFEDVAPSAWDPGERLSAMDRDRVAVHTLFPHVIDFAGERLKASASPAAWSACVSAYNDHLLLDICATAPDRLVGVALLPMGELEKAPSEIVRAARMGARAISLPHDPAGLGLPSFHDPVWVDVLDAADAADLAIMVHLGSGGVIWPKAGEPGWRPAATQVTAANFDVLQTTSDLAFSPLLTERPERIVTMIEGNIGWAPYLEERVDFAVANRRGSLASPGRPPSQVIHEQVYGSFLHDPLAIAHRHEIGIERLLWQSDFPHIDSLWPRSRDWLAEQLADVPENEARQIAELNARRLLRLPATPQARSAE